eukprot:Sspe_Gene.4523::Locus_1489_Transcript_1_1_Confidence_1.000_Length_17782::g.4523::m.4523
MSTNSGNPSGSGGGLGRTGGLGTGGGLSSGSGSSSSRLGGQQSSGLGGGLGSSGLRAGGGLGSAAGSSGAGLSRTGEGLSSSGAGSSERRQPRSRPRMYDEYRMGGMGGMMGMMMGMGGMGMGPGMGMHIPRANPENLATCYEYFKRCVDSCEVPDYDEKNATKVFNYLLDSFERSVRDDGTDYPAYAGGMSKIGADREPLPEYFPFLSNCTDLLLASVQKQLKAKARLTPRILLTYMCAHEVLKRLNLKRRPPSAMEQDALRFNHKRLEAQNGIVQLFLDMASKGATQQPEWDELKKFRSSSSGPTQLEQCLREWLVRLPYGEEGTRAYRVLLEFLGCLSGDHSSWKKVMLELLREPRDVRRAAELLLWHAHPKVASARSKYTPAELSQDDVELFVHRVADGIPADEVWRLISDRDRVKKAVDEGKQRREGRQLRAGPGQELVGRWFYDDIREYEIRRDQGEELVFRERTANGEIKGTIKVLGPGGDREVPPCPDASFSTNYGAILDTPSGRSCIWFSLRSRRGRNETDATLETCFHPSLQVVRENPRGAGADCVRRTAQKDVVGEETVVAFAARAIQAILKAPPTPKMLDKCKDAFAQLSELAEQLLRHLEDNFPVRYCHPASLVIIFQAMIEKDPSFKEKIYGSDGWFINHSKTHPCINLLTVLGRTLEAGGCPMNPHEVEMVLKNVAQYEVLGGTGDPAAILQALSGSARHDFDGTWTWVNGYREKNYERAFTITGHHIEVHHPALAGGELCDIKYTPEGMSFRIVMAEKPVRAPRGGARTLAFLEEMEEIDRVVSVPITILLTHGSGSEMDGVPRVTKGKWSGQHNDSNTSEFIRIEDVRSEFEWKDNAVAKVQQKLHSSATGWDAAQCRVGRGAEDFIVQAINDRKTGNAAFDKFLMTMWDTVASRVIQSAQFKSLDQLDKWMLSMRSKDGLSFNVGTLRGLKAQRREAATKLLHHYHAYRSRQIRWDGIPIDFEMLTILEKDFPDSVPALLLKLRKASSELQDRLNDSNISSSTLTSILNHRAVQEKNGIQFRTYDFQKPVNGISTNHRILSELIEKWGVKAGGKLANSLEENIRQRDTMPLKQLEQLHQQSSELLKPIIKHEDAPTSPFIRAHFHAMYPNGVPLDDFADSFVKMCQRIATLSLNDPVIVAVADLFPPEGNYAEGRRDQEQRLLADIGCPAEVISAIIDGALPLRFMKHGLASFKRLVEDPPSTNLRLHKDFFDDERQKELLLYLDVDKLPLRESQDKVTEVRQASAGCPHRVLEIIGTMLQCSSLVAFTRDNPEAQDTGLAQVLSNTRDMEHASFQTFLDCCNYVNPFVAASEMHVEMYKKQRREIEAGQEKSVLLRAPINCGSSWVERETDDIRAMGFWESLNTAFGDTGYENVAAIQSMLLQMSEKEKLDELNRMIDEQHGTTEKLILLCKKLCTPNSRIVVYLPPTGQPTLTSVLEINEDGKLVREQRSGAEYQDIVYRATLQKDIDEGLDLFVAQAREVLRAFNAAIGVFNDGHLEFRSRSLCFSHGDAHRVAGLLQGLQGQWASDAENDGERSVFIEKASKYPALACLSPAELVRMAELMRSVRESGELGINLHMMIKKWRGPRNRRIRRGMKFFDDEMVEGVTIRSECKPTTCYKIAGRPAVEGLETPYTAEESTPIVIEGSGVADGEYRPSLPVYEREDGAVLCPSHGGWVLYEKPEIGATRLLASVGRHDGISQPWAMGDWRELDYKGDLTRPNLDVRVKPDDAHSSLITWNTQKGTREEYILVDNVKDAKPLDLVKQDNVCYVKKVEKFSVWESLGFEKGTRITAVDNVQGTAEDMIKKFEKMCKGKAFQVKVQSPWSWYKYKKSDVDVSDDGRTAQKKGGALPSVVFSMAAGNEWRIKVSGNDVFGMRVGACTDGFDGLADSEENKAKGFWYLRSGMLRHNGVNTASARAYRSGDVISVCHNIEEHTLSFKLNDEPIGASFSGVPKYLRPCVYLARKGSRAELSPGIPTRGVMKWGRANADILLENNDALASRRSTESGSHSGVLGSTVFKGPGPHEFKFKVLGRTGIESCQFGVATPGVFLNKQYDSSCSLFGLTIRSDGNVFGLKENKALFTDAKAKFTENNVITFIVNTGEGTIEILRDDVRIVHTSQFSEELKFSVPNVPLTPYAVIGNNNIKVELLPCEARNWGEGPPAVVIKGSSPPPISEREREKAEWKKDRTAEEDDDTPDKPKMGPADGVYFAKYPTYVRSDGELMMYRWDGRWCVVDQDEKPRLWSNKCDEKSQLGMNSLRWTVVKGNAVPQMVRVVDMGVCGGIYVRDEGHKGHPVYMHTSKKLVLRWNADTNQWIICDPKDKNKALIAAQEYASLPHMVSTWVWGTGSTWVPDERIAVMEVDESEVRLDADGNPWTHDEYGRGWEQGKQVKTVQKEAKPELSLAVQVHKLKEVKEQTRKKKPMEGPWSCPRCTFENKSGTKCEMCEGERPEEFEMEGTLDSMTELELAGWHIIHCATGSTVRAPELRKALLSYSSGAEVSTELSLDWASVDEARKSVRVAAADQLDRIGQLLHSFKKDSHDPRVSKNFDPEAARFGQMQERTIEGRIVDTSKLPSTADRRAFGLSLFDELRAYHILDCSPWTPPEDVKAFIVRFKLMKQGRLVVNNLQLLGPDIQNEVRKATEIIDPDKEILAVITDGEGLDETVEKVDQAACDVRWRQWAHSRVHRLKKFETITYFDQKCGAGKSFAIKKMIEKKHWGDIEPVYLDLNSTTTSMDDVCRRLAGPLRAEKGLLVVHVGHDTPAHVTNLVLDSLAIVGRIQGPSGLAVTTPPKGWHLIVELQEEPEEMRKKELTLVSCKVGERGHLPEFDFSLYDGAVAGLNFLRENLTYLPSSNNIAGKMLVLGIQYPKGKSMPKEEEEPELYEELMKRLDTVTARQLARAMTFLGWRQKIYECAMNTKMRNWVGERELQVLVTHTLRHEINHFIFPAQPNHFYLRPTEASKPSMMLLSGTIPEDIEQHRKEYLDMLEKQHTSKSTVPAVRREVESAEKPVHALVHSLSDALGVMPKLVAASLAEKNYVLILDFLQKLIQLSEHVDLKDPAILQGPSGTGKSYAAGMLSNLMQLPPPRHLDIMTSNTHIRRKGYSDIRTNLWQYVRNRPEVKKLFPNNNSDQVGNVSGGIWAAECRTAYQSVKDAMAVISNRPPSVAFQALNVLRKALNDAFGPMLRDDQVNPDIAQLKASNPDFNKAVKALDTETDPKYKPTEADVKETCDNLEKLLKSLTHIGAGYLNQQMVQCATNALLSKDLKDIIDDKEIDRILCKRHMYDAMMAWARDAVRRAGNNGKVLCRMVRQHMRDELKKNPLLDPPKELALALAEGDDDLPSGEVLANQIAMFFDMKRVPAYVDILMRFDMTPDQLFEKMLPLLEKARKCPDIGFTVMIDEMNASNMLGLLKRIVVDRVWDKWEERYPDTKGVLPDNVAIIGAVNPHKKEAGAQTGGESLIKDELGFDVEPMPPSLLEFVVPWRQLEDNQRYLFIRRLLGNNRNLFQHHVPQIQMDALCNILLRAHEYVQKLYIKTKSRSTISQRDVHRCVRIFDWFFVRNRDFVTGVGGESRRLWDRALTAMVLGIAFSYYFRLSPEHREDLSNVLTKTLREDADKAEKAGRGFSALSRDTTFATVVQRAVQYYCSPEHLKLPEAVYAHNGLLENLFVQMVCFDIRIAVILHGPPGTSKTLSNNIIRDNMTGRGGFWKQFCTIVEVCRYQGSAQSSAREIKKKCEEAYLSQKNHDDLGHINKRSLLFVDEAGLVKASEEGAGSGPKRKYALKVLHYYLEGANIASVLMTNNALDPAISNRCIEVYMAEPNPRELASMCEGILHNKGQEGLTATARRLIPKCCDAFLDLLHKEHSYIRGAPGRDKMKWWYGLRDLFHMMRYIRRNQKENHIKGEQVTVWPELILQALERNFNGQKEYFNTVVEVFGRFLGEEDSAYSAEKLREHLRHKLDIVIDSIKDNNRATEGTSGKNLNDMWVRFKLIVDNTHDGTILSLLKQTKVSQFDDVRVLSLSALSQADELMPVTVVQQITAAMETGKTIWLTNTREIDACLFDVFNQSYTVAGNGSGEIQHFVAVAVGAALDYKRVHKNFQCIVHVTKNEASGMDKVLPSPFLNRLEKFALSVSDIMDYAADRLQCESAEGRMMAEKAALQRTRLERFSRTLSVRNKAVLSETESETYDSVILEAIQNNAFEPLLVDSRIAQDELLGGFLYGMDEDVTTWRSLACRLLQIMRPEAMLLAQKVLKDGAPAYIRAYFCDLKPWSMQGYLMNMVNDLRQKSEVPAWDRSIIYAPANVDFPSVLKSLEGKRVSFLSIEGLLESERGQEDLKEALIRFTMDNTLNVFVVIVSPECLETPVSRELRLLLDAPPELKGGRPNVNKAVVILQAFNMNQPVTPLFGSGWKQVLIDAAAEALPTKLLQYVDHEIAGRRPPRKDPSWEDMEALIDVALNSLLNAQIANEKWVEVSETDPAVALYDLRRPFADQVMMAKKLFHVCPEVRKALVDLHRGRLPTPEQLVQMANEVAMQENHTNSLAHRLLDEEHKAPRALLIFALRFLLDDRNASTLLTPPFDDDLSRQADRVVAKALHLCASSTTFDTLRRMKVRDLPVLQVGAVKPSLAGSSSLQEMLPVLYDADDVVAEAKRLSDEYKDGPVGELVNIVNKDERLILLFFRDCVRSRIRHPKEEVCDRACDWVLEFALGLHAERFSNEPVSVWTARALSVVEATAIDDYILAMVPLAEMGVLQGKPPSTLREKEANPHWVTVELCPNLLVKNYEEMTKTKKGLACFRTACSCLLHRAPKSWVEESTALPGLVVAACILSAKEPPLAKIKEFLDASMKSPVKIDTVKLATTLEVSPQTACKVILELAKIYEHFPKPEIRSFIFHLISSKHVTRAVACRAMSHVVPADGDDIADIAKAILEAAERSSKTAFKSKTVEYSPPCDTVDKSILGENIFTALYDVSLDRCMGLDSEKIEGNIHNLAKHTKTCHELSEKATDVAEKIFRTIEKTASEYTFLRGLARVFQRPPDNPSPSWKPSFMENEELTKLVSSVAKRLMEPQGFKCPAKGSKENKDLIENPPDMRKEAHMLTFIHALEQGTGSLRGMGTRAMLVYLRDQIPEKGKTPGAVIQICGEGMHHKCLNAEPLQTRPGDLPFVYKLDDPLHDPFMDIMRHFDLYSDAENATKKHCIDQLLELLKKFHSNGMSLEKVRLIFYYACLRQFLGGRVSHPMAKEMAFDTDLAKFLQLNKQMQRILWIALDRKQCTAFSDGHVDITTSLLEGFQLEWTEMVCTAMAMACAYKDSWLGTFLFDINALKGCYIPGDKTHNQVAEGGCYKLDCVTQLDENGNIDSYARGQEIMSTGSCYLLWGLIFSLYALQLTFFPETLNIFWGWMFSPTMHQRLYASQKALSNYRHMVGQLTERSVAYHLHMGSHTGLTVDEAQRMFAFYIYNFANEDIACHRMKAHQALSDAKDVERATERLWKKFNITDRQTLTRPQTDMCHTLRQLQRWCDTAQPRDLLRSGKVFTMLECLDPSEKPALLDMAWQESKKLELLPPLLKDLLAFQNLIHRMLNNKLPLNYVDPMDGETTLMTAYMGVMTLFRQYAPPAYHEEAEQLFANICQRWNEYKSKVGPIDYECQEGGINIELEGENGPIGDAGLPSTLDFWITLPTVDSPDPRHTNLLAAALKSLTDKYNSCQAIVAKYVTVPISDVDPALLNPTKPDLTLRQMHGIAEVVRSHVITSSLVNWPLIEEELAFASGLLLPRLLPPYSPIFNFVDPENPVGASEIEERANSMLQVLPDHNAKPLSDTAAAALQQCMHAYSQEQVIAALEAMCNVFEARDVDEAEPLYTALQKKWPTKGMVSCTFSQKNLEGI